MLMNLELVMLLGCGVELNVTHLTFQNNPSLLNQMSTPHLW